MTALGNLVRRNLRYKLLVLAVLPFVILVPAMLVGTLYWSLGFSHQQLFQRVTTDLAVARDAFERIQRDYLGKLATAAESYTFRTSLLSDDDGQLLAIVELLATTAGFDFVHLTDNRGWHRFQRTRKLQSKVSPLLERAYRLGLPSSGVEVYAFAELAEIDPALATRATLALVPTELAAPSARTREDRALVLRTLYPVRNLQGEVVALLEGGVLLSRNFAFVDELRDLVYGPGSLPEHGRGTVTLALGDVRISTNVPLAEGGRALGTRVAHRVRDAVLGRGEQWVGRNFVVDDWYISDYAPLLDATGEQVGLLETGLLEAPYRRAHIEALAVLAGVVLAGAVLAGGVLALGARRLFLPIESMMRVVRAVKAGEERRMGPVDSLDEVGELAREVDTMLELLKQKNSEIVAASDALEGRVAERTRELREKNRELTRTIELLHETRRQLALSEKLAALGELTAGVAHEINNPIAVMLGNLDVLVQDLGAHAEPVRNEIDIIIEQIYRVRAIVDKLLQYSRPAHYAGHTEALDPRAVIEDTLVLVNHELTRREARVETVFEHQGRVEINAQELQQVLVNLLLNAAQAVAAGGRIRIATANEPGGVVISVEDDGPGIPPRDLDRVFDPFFTTKRGGSGLGLSVSYGIVRHYGGRITVGSRPGAWTRFEVHLLDKPVYEQPPDVPATSQETV